MCFGFNFCSHATNKQDWDPSFQAVSAQLFSPHQSLIDSFHTWTNALVWTDRDIFDVKAPLVQIARLGQKDLDMMTLTYT